MGFFEFFGIDLTTIIGVLLNTLILFLIFKKFLFDKVNAVLDERNNSVAKTYEEDKKDWKLHEQYHSYHTAVSMAIISLNTKQMMIVYLPVEQLVTNAIKEKNLLIEALTPTHIIIYSTV